MPAPARRRFGFVVLSVFLFVALSLIVAGRRRLRPAAHPIRNAHDLASRLQNRYSRLHLVSTRLDGDLDWGFYLCDRPREREELQDLHRRPDQIERWQGVVHVEKRGNGVAVADDDWGDCGCAVGDFVLFGDPHMLQEIAATLR